MERKDLSTLLKGVGTVTGLGLAAYVGHSIGKEFGHPYVGGGLALTLASLFVNGVLEQKYDEIHNLQFYSHLKKEN